MIGVASRMTEHDEHQLFHASLRFLLRRSRPICVSYAGCRPRSKWLTMRYISSSCIKSTFQLCGSANGWRESKIYTTSVVRRPLVWWSQTRRQVRGLETACCVRWSRTEGVRHFLLFAVRTHCAHCYLHTHRSVHLRTAGQPRIVSGSSPCPCPWRFNLCPCLVLVLENWIVVLILKAQVPVLVHESSIIVLTLFLFLLIESLSLSLSCKDECFLVLVLVLEGSVIVLILFLFLRTESLSLPLSLKHKFLSLSMKAQSLLLSCSCPWRLNLCPCPCP